MSEQSDNYYSIIDKLSVQLSERKNISFLDKFLKLVDCVSTYQGEGPNCGKKMVLTRFKYCNLLCPFCDTQKLTSEINPTEYSLKDIQLLLKKSPNLMITGGEPTLDKFDQLLSTILMISNLDYEYVDIETNGLNILPFICMVHSQLSHKIDKMSKINISWSPKFIDKSHYQENINKLETLKSTYLDTSDEFHIEPTFKIVIGEGLDDYERFAYDAVLRHNYNPNKVYLMPKGVTYAEINKSMDKVLKVAEELGCNVSSRLHILHDFK